MRKKFLVILLAIVCVSMFVAPSVLAIAKFTDYESPLKTVVDKTGGLGENSDLSVTMGKVIQGALLLVGSIFFVLMVYAGYIWMMARGEEEKIKKARSTIIAAMIGILIVVGAYAITNLVVNRMIDGVSGGAKPKATVGDPMGCCLDRVKACVKGDPLTESIMVPMWAWRVTTKSDCKKLGSEPDPKGKDCLYGGSPGTWQFFEGKDATACQAEYSKV